MWENTHFILVNREPVAVAPDAWWPWFKDNRERIVAQEDVGDYWVSTVFVGLNTHVHGKPQLFETEVYVRGQTTHRITSATWDEAVQEHARTCQAARSGAYDKD